MSNEKNNINNTAGEPENKEKKETAKKPEKKVDPKKAEKKAAKQARRSLKARAFKRGWFSIALVVLCIAAVIIVNMIASALVSRVPALNFDTTGKDSFSLTDDTVDFVSKLEQDITIYVLASEKDYKDGGEYFIQANTLLHAYENASDKIKLQYVDLSTNPTFTEKYPEEDLATYNIIVQGEDSYKYLLETDLFEYDEEYLYYGSYVVNGSNVEEAVTSAILNVTLENKPKVTFISDVTEEDYSAFKTLLDNNGFETAEVSPTVGTIPEDTSIVVLYAPTTDLDSEFVNSLNDFLLNDGNYGRQLLYFPTYKLISLPNVDSLLEEWGLAVEQSYAVEQDTNYMANYYNYYVLFAAQYADTTYTANMSNSNLPVCFIQGSTRVVDILDSQSASALLTLTEQGQAAYADDSTETSDSPEAVYEDAPSAAVAAIATKSTVSTADTDTDSDSGATEEKKSNIIVIASSSAVSSGSLSRNTYGNSSYILSLLNTVTGRGDVGIAIESKTMDGTELGITSSQLYALGTVFIAIIPVIILIAGIVVFVKRKNM